MFTTHDGARTKTVPLPIVCLAGMANEREREREDGPTSDRPDERAPVP